MLKGKERNQIPMFALTITKPFRLTDAIYKSNYQIKILSFKIYIRHFQYTLQYYITGDLSPVLDYLNKLIAFSTKSFEINFKQAGISAKVVISLFMEPYLNIIKISVCNLDDLEVNFFNSVPTKQNNLFQTTSSKQECWLHNPQICQVL